MLLALGSLWACSAAFRALTTALNVMYDANDSRALVANWECLCFLHLPAPLSKQPQPYPGEAAASFGAEDAVADELLEPLRALVDSSLVPGPAEPRSD